MSAFTARVKRTFGATVFRAVAEVGPFDSEVRMEVLEEDGETLRVNLFPEPFRAIPIDVAEIDEVSDTEWIVTDRSGRRFSWRKVSDRTIERFTEYMKPPRSK